MERKTEIRNWEPEEPCKKTPKECYHFLLLLWSHRGSGTANAGNATCAHGSRAYTCASPTRRLCWALYYLCLLWNKLAQYHLSSSSLFTLWFISVYPLWMGFKCIHALHVHPTIGQASNHVKRTVISDNVLCETFTSYKFSLFSKKK